MSDNSVGIVITNNYHDINQKLSRLINSVGGLDLSNGERILIKINLCAFREPNSGAITHPLFLDALLRYLRENFEGLEIMVIESDATSSKPDITLKWFGIDKVLEKWGAKWYNLTKNPTVMKRINGFHFKKLEISEIFEEYDYFITTAKLKTHSLTKITAALKNQYGCIPYKRKVRFHKYLDEVIADANLAMKPDFCLIDGVISLCGGVAIYGIPKRSNIIIAGHDPVSVDTTCARILGYNPKRVGHVQKAKKLGVGTDKFVLSGDIQDLKEVAVDREISMWRESMLRLGRFLRNRFSQ